MGMFSYCMTLFPKKFILISHEEHVELRDASNEF